MKPPPHPRILLPPPNPTAAGTHGELGSPHHLRPPPTAPGGVPPSPEGLSHPGAVSPSLVGTVLRPGISLQVTLHTGLPVPEFYASRSAMQ